MLGDWDGDGTATLGLFRGGRWFLRTTNAPLSTNRTFGFGVGGDRPVVGDWDADGDTDIAVTRGTRWYQRDAASGGPVEPHLPVRPVRRPARWPATGTTTAATPPGCSAAAPGSSRSATASAATRAPRSAATATGRSCAAPPASRPAPRTGASATAPPPSTSPTVDLAAASSPDAVLSGGNLRGLETTSSMGRRTGAALAVNGDYFLGNGRPVHAMAADGRLLQTPQLLGRAFSLDGTGTQVADGLPRRPRRPHPAVRDRHRDPHHRHPLEHRRHERRRGRRLHRRRRAASTSPSPTAATSAARSAARPCAPTAASRAALTVSGTRCYGAAPYVSPTGTVLATEPLTARRGAVPLAPAGSTLPTTSYLGFPGAVDLLGGNPLLLRDGVPQSQDHTGSGAFFAAPAAHRRRRHAATAGCCSSSSTAGRAPTAPA